MSASLQDCGEQSETIAFLANPETFGIGEPVIRRETHAAIVFLAGDFAYKLKRAVRYPYLDYSTVERRRAMCKAELDVNRRTAPDLYIGTRPIVKRQGALSLGTGADDTGAVDWVVVMRRFSESDLLENRLATGSVSPDLFRDLAVEIARFHQSAEHDFRFGGSAAISRMIAESRNLICSFEPAIFAPGTADTFALRAGAELSNCTHLLDLRRRNGFVRRCHGDLHLGNICVRDGHPVLFDAIEFNDDFSCIDVFYDLAFLLMALDFAGARWAANLVLNRYLELTSDYEAIAALPLFLACRASVRAHVAATRANREAIGSGDEAAKYAQSAIAYAAAPHPMLVALGGVSGTGKSLLARNLAPLIGASPGAVILRSDVIRKRQYGVSADTHLPGSAYTAETTARVYGEMRRIAELVLASGYSVIADAVHGSAGERAEIQAVASNANAGFAGIWLEAEISEIETRLGARRGDASDAGIEVARDQTAHITAPADWFRLNASQKSPEACLDSATGLLRLTPSRDGSSVHA